MPNPPRDLYYLLIEHGRTGPFNADEILAFVRVFESVTIEPVDPALGERPITIRHVREKNHDRVKKLIDVSKL